MVVGGSSYGKCRLIHELDEQEPNRVISELEKGYLLHERLLRPAKVFVSKALPEKKTETK